MIGISAAAKTGVMLVTTTRVDTVAKRQSIYVWNESGRDSSNVYKSAMNGSAAERDRFQSLSESKHTFAEAIHDSSGWGGIEKSHRCTHCRVK